MMYIIVTCALHLYFLTVRWKMNFREALEKGAGSAVAFSISVVVIWPVLALLTYHLRVCLDYIRISRVDTDSRFSYSSSTSQQSSRFVGLKALLRCAIHGVPYRSGTRPTKRLPLGRHLQTPFPTGGGRGILLMFFADQPGILGWMVIVSRPKIIGKLIQGS